MDKKDEKILIELIKNSRISMKQLGKRTGVSREVATYRVKKLMEEKIITDFYPIIDIEKLGYFKNGCWIQLKNADHKKEREFFTELVKNPFVTFVGSVVGKWNVAFDIISRDSTHLMEILKEIKYSGKSIVENVLITNNTTEQEVFETKMLGVKEHKKLIKKYPDIKLDNIDKRLLELLSTNSRIEYVDLSKRLNLAANTIKYRIKKLESSGIIEGYTISVDFVKLGYEFYNVQIKIESDLIEGEIKNFLRNHIKVIYFYKYLGHENWDMDIGVLAKNSVELREVILEIKNYLGTGIKIHDIYSSIDILKPNIAPKGVFE